MGVNTPHNDEEDQPFIMHHSSYDGNRSSRHPTLDRLPSIDIAKDFQLKSRPHRISDPTQPSGFRLARSAEDYDELTGAQAEPYHLWSTGYQSFDEFGIGLALYFRQLIFLSIIFFIGGCILVPAIVHNASFFPKGTSFLLWGSAVGAQRSDLSFWLNGVTEMILVSMLLFTAAISNTVEEKAAAKIDLSQQTAQDYAVCIINPLEDVRDPDAYLPLFQRYGEVVMITLALDNGNLITKLAQERELEEKEEEEYQVLSSSPSSSSSTTCPWWKILLWNLSMGQWEDKEVVAYRKARLSSSIEKMVSDPEAFKVKRVFAIYEQEQGQRACLTGMMTSFTERNLQPKRVDKEMLEGESPEARILNTPYRVIEPVEPSEVIWENLHHRMWRRWMWFSLSFSVAGVVLVVSYLILLNLSSIERETSSLLTAFIITMINALLPLVMREATSRLEIPLTNADLQESMMLKLVVSRCLNTAVIQFMVIPYTKVLAPKSLFSVATILLADCLFPFITLLDIPRLLQQRFLAPRATTQKQLDSYFAPKPWLLAERYTDVIKTIFVGLFYSAIFPTSLFITSLAMAIVYWVDKACLFYKWKRAPAIDSSLAGASRDFLAICLATHTIITRIFFANWPYQSKQERTQCVIFFCFDNDALSSTQVSLVSMYNIFVWVTVFVVIQHKSWGPIRSLVSYITGKPFFQGHATTIPYRSVRGIHAYVPIIFSNSQDPHAEPYLTANVDDVPREYLPLHPKTDPHSKSLLVSSKRNLDPRLFSVIKYYAPRSPETIKNNSTSSYNKTSSIESPSPATTRSSSSSPSTLLLFSAISLTAGGFLTLLLILLPASTSFWDQPGPKYTRRWLLVMAWASLALGITASVMYFWRFWATKWRQIEEESEAFLLPTPVKREGGGQPEGVGYYGGLDAREGASP